MLCLINTVRHRMMSIPSDFLDLPLHRETQDRYFIRKAILAALRKAMPRFHGTFLDVGAGVQPYRNMITEGAPKITRYLGMDLETNAVAGYRKVTQDLYWDGGTIPLDDSSVDSAMATEVLEHCPDPGAVLREIARVMRPGGVFFFTVPFLWPLHDVPYDEYRYTPFALERLVREAGFDEVVVRPHGGWDASLAQMIGLWARRRPMSDRKRNLVSRITLPVVRYLLRHDHVPDPRSSPMVLGLSGTAVRR